LIEFFLIILLFFTPRALRP